MFDCSESLQSLSICDRMLLPFLRLGLCAFWLFVVAAFAHMPVTSKAALACMHCYYYFACATTLFFHRHHDIYRTLLHLAHHHSIMAISASLTYFLLPSTYLTDITLCMYKNIYVYYYTWRVLMYYNNNKTYIPKTCWHICTCRDTTFVGILPEYSPPPDGNIVVR